jgi:hypothetical protein
MGTAAAERDSRDLREMLSPRRSKKMGTDPRETLASRQRPHSNGISGAQTAALGALMISEKLRAQKRQD